MVAIGNYNTLKVVKHVDFGIYLDGGELGEILMPQRYVPANTQPEDDLEVFIYRDSEDRLLATTEKPFATVGSFAYLKVTAVNTIGAFLDWGLPKDLLVPFREQKQNMERGRSYLVYVYLDVQSQRIAATAKIDKYLDIVPAEYTIGQEVDLIISDKTDLGYKVLINQSHKGIIYKNEVFQKLQTGQYIKGFIKTIREDGKIDACLQKPGYKKVESLEEKIITILMEDGGRTPVNEKSTPEIIYDMFGVSKKAFKMALGALYKKRIIDFDEQGSILLKKVVE